MLTIEEARKTLGPKYDTVPDHEIAWLILLFSTFSKYIIREYSKDPKWLLRKLKKAKQAGINKERHLANKMQKKATIDQKIAWHIEHHKNCKCRPIPDNIKKEIQKRLK